MVENFGNYLKHERELRGVLLQEISDNTKISVRFLEALENNRFDELPGEVFIKGFIRSYAKSIGTNEDEIIAVFDESVGKQRKEKVQKLEAEKNRLHKEKQKRLRIFLLIFISLVILLTSIYLTPLKTETAKTVSPSDSLKTETLNPAPSNPANPPVDALPGELDAPPPVSADDLTGDRKDSEPLLAQPADTSATLPETSGEEAVEQAATEKSVELTSKDDIIQPTQENAQEQSLTTGPEEEIHVVVAPRPLELTVRATEHAWFKLTVDDSREEDFILPIGAGRTFRGQNSIKITIGNRSGTQLFLNGEPLNLPESPDNVIRDFLIQAEPIE